MKYVAIILFSILPMFAFSQSKGNLLENSDGSVSAAALKASGVVQNTSTTYVSGTGTAGTDNTAMTVLTRTLAANTMSQVGDRIRIRAYYQATGGAAIVGTIKVNNVSTANLSASATDLQVVECWLHYIDATHANIIENEAGALGALSAINAAGFS